MMKSLIFLSTAATAFAASFSSISMPSNIATCGTYTLPLSGVPPFQIDVLAADFMQIFETIDNITTTEYNWRVMQPAGTEVQLYINPSSGPSTSEFIVIQPGDAVPQWILPGPGQCFSGDTGTTLTSDSTCSSLTADGSTIYIDSSNFACCDSIPAGTFVCKHPVAPICDLVPTDAAATTSCRTSERSITLRGVNTCEFLNGVLGTTTSDFYTVSGSNICCGFIPAGTTICLRSSPPSTCSTATQTSIGATPTGSAPAILQSYNSWSYTGCYDDSIGAPSMPTIVTTINANAMTVEKCLDACNALGHLYAGLGWSEQCYCADALPPTKATDRQCNLACQGNELEICGGDKDLTVYTYTPAPIQAR